MKTKLVRVEQKEANLEKVDIIVNNEISKLEAKGFKITDLKISVGRDADASSGIQNRFCVSILIMYE